VTDECETAEYCEDGKCKGYVCTPDDIWCDGQVYKVCSEDGKSLKHEEDCGGMGKYCSVSGCIDTVCEPDSKFCVDNFTKGVCDTDGMDFFSDPCPDQHFCELGACWPFVCAPGEAFCEQNLAKVCNPKGSGVLNEVDCAENTCVAGVCEDLVCNPGEDFCSGNFTIGHCSDDGLSFTPEDCPGEHGCVNGVCYPWVCTPLEWYCDGDKATKCGPNGLEPDPGEAIDCGAQGKFCSGGECVDCEPQCEGKQCGDDGCGGQCGDCDDGDICTVDQCSNDACLHFEQDGCCSGDWECDDGDNCTAEICQGLQGCLYTIVACCGDLIMDPGEECEDGNQNDGDGCSAECLKEGVIEFTWTQEETKVCQDDFDDFAAGVLDVLPEVPVSVELIAHQAAPLDFPGYGDWAETFVPNLCVREWLVHTTQFFSLPQNPELEVCLVESAAGDQHAFWVWPWPRYQYIENQGLGLEGYCDQRVFMLTTDPVNKCGLTIVRNDEQPLAEPCCTADVCSNQGGTAGDFFTVRWWF